MNKCRNKLEGELNVNNYNKYNVDLWTKLFLRIKPIQRVVREMTEQVEMILRKELIHNREQLEAYVNFPRIENVKMSIVPPPEKQKLPFDDLGKKIYGSSEDKVANAKVNNKEDQSIAAMHFRRMKSGMNHIERMIDGWENDEAQFSTQIDTWAGEKKELSTNGSIPLERLQNMLEDWDKQDVWTKDELMEYAHELWKTAEQFENELK